MSNLVSNRPGHHLALPLPFFVLKVVQLVLAVVILGLAAYGVTYIAFDGIALTLFTSLATILIVAYFIVSSLALKVVYNYWVLAGLDIFAIIFWLCSFAVTAARVAAYSSAYNNVSDYSCTYYYGYCYKKRGLAPRRLVTNYYTYRNSMAAAAGLGGLEFILFVVTLAFTIIFTLRHRKAGGHATPSRANRAPASQPIGAPVPLYATEPKPQQQYAQQPQQQYAQPPQPQQQYAQPPQPGFQPVQTPSPQPGFQPVQTPSPQPGYQPVQSPPPGNHQLPA